MIKKYLKLLLVLLIIPLFFGISNSVNLYADSTEGEETKEYEYEETRDDLNSVIYRRYLSDELLARVEKRFCAPSGYEFVLSLTDEQAEAIASEADKVGAKYDYAGSVFYYYISGSRIYANSDYLFDSNPSRENYVEFIHNSINGLSLFKVEELTIETEIVLDYTFEVSTTDGLYNFMFQSDPIVIEPYDEYDFINFSATYYQIDNKERRINLRANPINGFFYETPNINYNTGNYNSGFHTDTVTEYEGYDQDETGRYPFSADYEITFLANDTIPISGNNNYGQLEITYPDEPMPVRARMTFMSEGKKYTFYSKTITLGDPDIKMTIDGYASRDTITKNSVHTFSVSLADFFPVKLEDGINLYLYPLLLDDKENGHYLYDTKTLPETGIEGHFYYVPTDEEAERYKNGEEVYPDGLAYGSYYKWNKEENKFDPFWSIEILNTEDDYVNDDGWICNDVSIPYSGKWGVGIYAGFGYENCGFMIQKSQTQTLDVIVLPDTDDYIKLNVSDNLNVLQNAGDIEVEPTVVTESQVKTDYYFKWSLNKEGIVNITELEDGNIVITPIGVGIVDLTVECESALFSKITKTIKIRSIDSIYDIAKLTVPDEFHYAGKDLEVAVEIRGFKHFQNLDIEWTVLDKNDNIVDPNKYIDNKDGTITILQAERNDYKITASYQGIELDTITVQVRKINVNLLIRQNIWWIFLITISFVFVIFFLKSMLKRGKTTVESIDRVYGVYCECLSDDKLTLLELKKINREIKKCLHRCEDLNIESLNQYEKAIRYLRKSDNDAKTLLKSWDNVTPEEKSVYCERLDADLSKALNVAKEIENAKQLIEEYHTNANKNNYEKLKEEDKPKKNKKD